MIAIRKVPWLAIANCGLVVLLLLTLWVPLLLRQQVSAPAVGASDVEAWRSIPEGRVDALWNLALDQWELHGSDIITRADEILGERLRLTGRPAVQMQGMSWWADPFRDPLWRIQLQGLRHVGILLGAWHMTRQPKYLSKARDVIISWIEFARRSPSGGGLMWNDEATADRAVALSLFWTAYAKNSMYDPAIGAMVLRSIAQHVGFLTDARHFTFLTNHGVMQNLALLHIASTLPVMGTRTGLIDIAVRRLTLQYRVLVSPEGVWTEHSPGYQLLGVRLLRGTIQYLQILGRPIPEEWHDELARLQTTLVQLARPDGSLPPIGDTIEAPRSGHAWPSGIVGAVRDGSRLKRFLAPCGGYVVLWEGSTSAIRSAKARQVVMTVSNFRGHAHKHADELSIYLFGEGRTWLTGPGYWPYWSRGRQYAEGWTGANAPAFDGEAVGADRRAQLVGYAQAGWGDFVEMQRSGPIGFHAQRQVVWVRPDWLIIGDQIKAPDGKRIVLRWLLSPEISVEGGTEEGWVARAFRGSSTQQLRMWVLSERPVSVTIAPGNEQPFRGWVYTGEEVQAAPEFEIRPENQQAFVVTVFHLEPRLAHSSKIAKPRLTRSWGGWSVSFGNGPELSNRFDRHPATMDLSLNGTTIDGKRTIQPLFCSREMGQTQNTTQTALETEYAMSFTMRGTVSLTRYEDVTFLVIGAWLCQEVSLLMIRRRAPKLVGNVRLASCAVIVCGGLWLLVRWWGANVV